MKYLPLALTIAGIFYLLANNINGWGWALFFAIILLGVTYGKD